MRRWRWLQWQPLQQRQGSMPLAQVPPRAQQRHMQQHLAGAAVRQQPGWLLLEWPALHLLQPRPLTAL